jgi:hypothetical protein
MPGCNDYPRAAHQSPVRGFVSPSESERSAVRRTRVTRWRTDIGRLFFAQKLDRRARLFLNVNDWGFRLYLESIGKQKIHLRHSCWVAVDLEGEDQSDWPQRTVRRESSPTYPEALKRATAAEPLLTLIAEFVIRVRDSGAGSRFAY